MVGFFLLFLTATKAAKNILVQRHFTHLPVCQWIKYKLSPPCWMSARLGTHTQDYRCLSCTLRSHHTKWCNNAWSITENPKSRLSASIVRGWNSSATREGCNRCCIDLTPKALLLSAPILGAAIRILYSSVPSPHNLLPPYVKTRAFHVPQGGSFPRTQGLWS